MAKRIVFSFGRLNPITIGHEVLVNKVVSMARSRNAIARIYLSHSQSATKDPLSYSDKISFARAAFGKVVTKSNAKTIIEIMKSLDSEKFTDVTMIAGSDRVDEFERLLNKYNGKDYTMDSITILSAGERDPDAEGVVGMSGSKMRELAKTGKEKEFIAGAASKMPLLVKKKMYKAVIAGLTESWENDMTLDEKFENLFEADDEGDADIMATHADAKKMLDDIDVTDLDPHEHDAYFLHIIAPEHIDADDPDSADTDDDVKESAEPAGEVEPIEEAGVFSIARRIKLSMRMRRMAKRYSRIRQLKAKRMAPVDRLRYRARKAALMSIRKRLIGKTKKYEDLPRQQKISIDQQIARRFGKKLSARVTMLSTRLLPAIRKKEMERLASARSRSAPKTEDVAAQLPTSNDHLHLSKTGELKKKKLRVFEELFLESRKSAAADQGAEGDLNIIYQLRKVQRLGAAFKVTWTDGTKTPVSIQHAMKAQNIYQKMMSKPGVSGAQKQRFVRKLGKDEKSFLSALKEDMYYSKGGKCDYCTETDDHMHDLSKKGSASIKMDELSDKTLGSYIKKSSQSASVHAAGAVVAIGKQQPRDRAVVTKRKAGIGKAVDRLTKEEAEQVDELSKATLGSYIKKASHDVATKSAATGRYGEKSRKHSDDAKKGDDSNWMNTLGARSANKVADMFFKQSWKRRGGIAKAVNKLTKEGAEQVDELSKATLGSYIKKSSQSASKHQSVSDIERKYPVKGGFLDRSGEFGRWRADMHLKMATKRKEGIAKAVNKLTKEEAKPIEIEEGMSGGYHASFHKVTGKIGYIGSKSSAIKHVKSNSDHSIGYTSPGKKVGDIFAGRRSLLHWAQLRGDPKTPVKKEQLEGAEQVDELSKATLGSYIKKASHKMSPFGALDAITHLRMNRRAVFVPLRGPHAGDAKRREGIGRAVRKLTKEGVKISEIKQRLDPKCWDGYEKQGTKIKGGIRVNNCVPSEEVQVEEAVNRAGGGRAHPDARRAALIAKMAKHSPKLAAAMAKSKPAEDKKVEEAVVDTDSRLTPKLDMLLRLGLVSSDSINRYRAALRGGEKSLANPELRRRLVDLLDRLLDLSTHDPQTYNRLRTSIRDRGKKVEEAVVDTDSRLTPKLDMLLRLGLVSADSINRYRAALRGGEKSLANPELRRRLVDLLDRLLNLSTQDPQTYNRLRTTIRDRDTNEDALANKHDSEQDALAVRHAREKANVLARTTVTKVRKKELKDEVQLSASALNNLNEKATKHNVDIDIILEVYARGLNAWEESPRKLTREQWAFNRVNSFLSGGLTQISADADLWERVSGGEFGSDELRKNYANSTPGQKEELVVASFSARKPWVGPNEENVTDSGKTPKTYQDIRKAISGIREEG